MARATWEELTHGLSPDDLAKLDDAFDELLREAWETVGPGTR